MAWWAWILLGFFLLLAELLTPGGFYLLFFGTGALIVGVLVLLQVGGPSWLQLLLFSALSTAAVVLFRRPLVQRFGGRAAPQGTSEDTDSLVGESAVAMETIAAGDMGRVEMRGSSWRARNLGERPLASGQRCTVERVQGLMLEVRPH
jgi:hypothetical protein